MDNDTPIFDNVNNPPRVVDHTPNIHIPNPNVRVAVRTVLDTIGGGAFIAQAVDIASPVFDIAWLTVPILSGYAVARVVFGFAVDNPNTPNKV